MKFHCWGSLWPTCGPLGSFWCLLGVAFGTCFGLLGRRLVSLGTVWGPFWLLLGASGWWLAPPWELLGRLVVLDFLGTVWGSSWDLLGASLNPTVAILPHSLCGHTMNPTVSLRPYHQSHSHCVAILSIPHLLCCHTGTMHPCVAISTLFGAPWALQGRLGALMGLMGPHGVWGVG